MNNRSESEAERIPAARLDPVERVASATSGGGGRWRLAILAVAAILLLLNVKLLTGVVGPHWDAEDFFAPAFSLVADHARAGRIVLWDPWIAGGSPDFAEPEFGTSSPLTMAVGFITGGSEVGFRAYWLLIWFLGPLGVVLLSRHLGAPAWGGFIGAVGFAFSGFYTGHAEHTSSLYSICLLPFVVWRLDAALNSQRLAPATEAGAFWGLSALGGYPQLTILTGGYVLMWALGRACCPEPAAGTKAEAASIRAAREPSPRPRLLFTLAAVATVAIVGILILSPPYLAYFTETFGYSDRVGPRPRQIAVGLEPLALGALTTFSSPYLSILKLFGNPTLWRNTDVSMSSVYLGAPLFILGVSALVLRPRSRWRWWLAGTGGFFLLGALGDQTPLRGWLYDLMPPTRYFRNPALFRVYAMFSMAVLALLATKEIESTPGESWIRVWRRLFFVAVVAAIGAIGAYTSVVIRVEHTGPHFAIATLQLALVWGGGVIVVAMVAMSRRRRWLPALLVALAILDGTLAFGLSQPVLYSSATRPRWDRINEHHRSQLVMTNGLTRRLRPPEWLGPQLNNRNLPLKVATFANYMTLSNRFQQQLTVRPVLAEMSTGADRIWFASHVATAGTTDAVYRAFLERSERLRAPVMVLHSRADMARIHPPGEVGSRDGADRDAVAQLPSAVRQPARVAHYGTNDLRLQVSCPTKGWLLVTDRWAPGWQATVNGAKTEVSGANFLFRALPVDAGTNDIAFEYRPKGWRETLALSWGTLAVTFVRRLWRLVRR